MPGSFMSTPGCLFSSLAWVGIAISLISGFVSIIAENKRVMTTICILLVVLPVLAVLLIIGDYNYLSDVRQYLSDDVKISNSQVAVFKYLPEYRYTGYFKLGFPTTDEANHIVRRLRYTTVGMIVACFIALIILAYRSINALLKQDNRLPAWLTPSLVLGSAGLLVVLIHIISVFI